MNRRFISVLIFAFIVATGASVLLYRMMSNHDTVSAQKSVKVVMATRNLDPGTLIKDTDLRIGDWPGQLPPGAIGKIEDAVGRGVISAVFSGEPILDTRLAAKGGGAGLAAMIPPGMRAVAIRVNDVVGVAGFVTAGMRVDILVSGNPPGQSASGSLTKTLLQNIEVLSAGQDFKRDAEGKPMSVQVVNLLVTPEQAEILSLASNETRIQLVLRNPLDSKVATTAGTRFSEIFTGVKETKPTPPPAGSPAPVKRAAKPRPIVTAAAAPALAPMAPAAAPAAPAANDFVTVEMISGTRRVQASFKDKVVDNNAEQKK